MDLFSQVDGADLRTVLRPPANIPIFLPHGSLCTKKVFLHMVICVQV